MDLSNKLNILAGKSSFECDKDLAGISEPENSFEVVNNSSDEEPFDFNLGELSIDSYLQDSGYKSKKKSKKNAPILSENNPNLSYFDSYNKKKKYFYFFNNIHYGCGTLCIWCNFHS